MARPKDLPSLLSGVEACIPALRRYAVSLLRDRQDADDLVHDCLVRALDHLGTREEAVSLRPWLFAILHNRFISLHRRRQRRPDREALDPAREFDVEPAQWPRPHQEAHLHLREVVQGVERLPEEQRQVLLLVCVEGLSYAEIAHVLGIPTGTVMSRLSRARDALRKYVEGIAHEGAAPPALRRVK